MITSRQDDDDKMIRWQDDKMMMTRTPAEAEQENKSSAEEGGGGTSTDKKKELAPGSRILEFCILYFFSCLYFAFFVFCIYFFNFLVFCILFCAWSQPRPLGRRTSTPASTRPSRPCVETWSSLYLIVVNYKPSLVIIPLVDVLLVQVVEWHHFLQACVLQVFTPTCWGQHRSSCPDPRYQPSWSSSWSFAMSHLNSCSLTFGVCEVSHILLKYPWEPMKSNPLLCQVK